MKFRFYSSALCLLIASILCRPALANTPHTSEKIAGWWIVFARDIDDREWHASLRIADAGEGDAVSVVGEFEWDTPSTSASTLFGTEEFTGEMDPATATLSLAGFDLENNQRIATADYSTKVAADGMSMYEGVWTGDTVKDSDFWHAVKSSAVESAFDTTLDGWLPVGEAAFTWSETDGDRNGIGILSSDGPGEITAPSEFLGDLSWRGRVPTLLTFAIRRFGPQRFGSKGPMVRISGPAGEAQFVVNKVVGSWRTYVVPLWAGVWDVEEGVRFEDILEDVDTLIISPNGNRQVGPGFDDYQNFRLDDIRLLQPLVKPIPRILEWHFAEGGPTSVAGPEQLTIIGEDPEDTTEFVTTDGLTIPHINGEPTPIAVFPAFDTPGAGQGVELQLTTVPPNGGGQFINRYTFIWDILIPGTIGAGVPLVHTPQEDFFSRFDLGIQGFAPLTEGFFSIFGAPTLSNGLTANRWYRVVETVDTIKGKMSVYLDGTPVLVGDINGFDRIDSGAAMASMDTGGPAALFFKDIEGTIAHEIAVSNIAFVDVAMTPAQIALLDGPDARGSLALIISPLTIQRGAAGSVDLHFVTPQGFRHRLQFSEKLHGWTDLDMIEGTGISDQRNFSTATDPIGFYRLVPELD